jgi:hypothetical protein
VIEATAAKAILAHVHRGELVDGFTARDVRRHGWSGLIDHTRVQAGLDLLVEFNYLTPAPARIGQPGRPKAAFMINPAVFR